jgi:hypothetical protein
VAFRKRASGVAGKARINPSSAKNALGVAKVIGPVVLPIVVPYLAKAASAVRERIDLAKARKLGVPVGDLAKYTGRGGALHARITGAAEALSDLRDRPNPSADETAFANTTETTLRQLAAAVRAAERMPTARRKAAHKAVAAELGRVEDEVLRRLGVR